MGENGQDEMSEEKLGVFGGSDSDGATFTPMLSLNSWDWLMTFDTFSDLAQNWWTESDFQLKLLFILLAWLFFNLCFISICWRKYGDKLSHMLIKEESGMKESFEGKIGLHTEDPLHNKYYHHPSQAEKMHRD